MKIKYTEKQILIDLLSTASRKSSSGGISEERLQRAFPSIAGPTVLGRSDFMGDTIEAKD